VRRQALSLGCEVDVWAARRGAVHSVFAGAINLLVGGEMWTLLDAAKSDSPFGIRLAPGVGPHAFGVQRSAPVHVRSGFIGVGGMVLDCRSALRWAAVRWPPPGAGFEARLAEVERLARPRAWADSAAMAGDVMRALCAARGAADAQCVAAVRRTIGRGPGLTPAGDDVLVGIMAILSSGAAGEAGARAMERLVRAMMPALPSTTDLSRHLLAQAARGLSGRALHDLGRALVKGAADDALAAALAPVLATGATSGADACIGLVAAGRTMLIDAERFAA